MAVMLDEDRRLCWAQMYRNGAAPPFNKNQFRTALNETDAWADANTSVENKLLNFLEKPSIKEAVARCFANSTYTALGNKIRTDYPAALSEPMKSASPNRQVNLLTHVVLMRAGKLRISSGPIGGGV